MGSKGKSGEFSKGNIQQIKKMSGRKTAKLQQEDIDRKRQKSIFATEYGSTWVINYTGYSRIFAYFESNKFFI